jgi:hypothetical protein
MIFDGFGGDDIMEQKLILKNAIAKFDAEICFINAYVKCPKGGKNEQNYYHRGSGEKVVSRVD